MPDSWEERLILYVGFLIDQKRQSSTIKSYVSAIRAILMEAGHTLSEDTYLLKSLTKACKLINDEIKLRFPIRKGMMELLLNQIDVDFNCIYHKRLYKALFSTAYYGLFRIGEITKSLHVIQARDVHIALNKKKVLFLLRSSKTHGKNAKPQTVKITASSNTDKKSGHSATMCPFNILQDVLKSRKSFVHIDEQFFVFRDRSAVTPAHFHNTFKILLYRSGFNTSAYSGHSFRGGRSVDLFSMGMSIDIIRKLGRWSPKSSSVYAYLKYA